MRTAGNSDKNSDFVVGDNLATEHRDYLVRTGGLPPLTRVPARGHVAFAADVDALGAVANLISELQQHAIAGHQGKLELPQWHDLADELRRCASLFDSYGLAKDGGNIIDDQST